MPTTLLKQSRNPHEICLGLAIIAAAVAGVVLGPLSVTMREGVSAPQQLCWGAMSAAGGLTSLIGSFMKKPITGLKFERAGQFMLGCGAAAYSALLMNESTFERSGLVIIITTGIACGAFGRVWQVWHGLNKLRKAGIL